MLLQFGTLDNMVCHFQGFFKEFLLYISVRIGVFVRPWNRHLTHFDTAWILSGYLTCFWKHFHNCKILEIQSNLKIVNYLASPAKLFVIARRLSVYYITIHFFKANWQIGQWQIIYCFQVIHYLSVHYHQVWP